MTEAEFLEDFKSLDSWEEKYEFLIEIARKIPKLIDAEKKDSLKVEGCSSRVWLKLEIAGDKIQFIWESDSMLVKSLIYFLLLEVQGVTISQAQLLMAQDAFPKTFLDLNFQSNISLTRQAGLQSVWQKARELLSKQSSS